MKGVGGAGVPSVGMSQNAHFKGETSMRYFG